MWEEISNNGLIEDYYKIEKLKRWMKEFVKKYNYEFDFLSQKIKEELGDRTLRNG